MRKIAVAGTALVSLAVAAAAVDAQSLGTIASEEAARRRAIVSPARVITDADLPQSPAGPPVEPADSGIDLSAAPRFVARTPARLRGGAAPQIPVRAVGGGDVAVELAVSRDGRVAGVDVLRESSPFTEAVADAVRGWSFDPATDSSAEISGEGEARPVTTPVASKVLVLGLFRPPALFPGTLGVPPVDVGRASAAVPYPASPPQLPAYPPNALVDGVVMLELAVAGDGSLARVRVVQPAAGFDQAALDAARTIRFRPARVHDRPATALVYVVMAFRQPITP